jgi:single-strand DNA-binding protein
MSMNDNITVRGFVASEIRTSTTPGGVGTASFRLGSTERHFDRTANVWVDGNTNWFTVQGYRQLAGNIGCSIKKGQRVIVVGRLKLRSWEKDGRVYHAVDIDAESVGHDLMWGSANFIRTAGGGPAAGQDAAAGNDAPGDAGHDGQGGADHDVDASGDGDAGDEDLEFDEATGELKETAA